MDDRTEPSDSVAIAVSKYEAARERVHDILTISNHHDPAARSFGFFITVLMILNVLAVVLQTVESLDRLFGVA